MSVGRAHAFDGLIRSSVVEVTAAARRAISEYSDSAPRPGDVLGIGGRVLPGGHRAYVDAFIAAAERGGVRRHAQRGTVHLLDQHDVAAILRVSEVVVDDVVDQVVGQRVDEVALPIVAQPEWSVALHHLDLQIAGEAEAVAQQRQALAQRADGLGASPAKQTVMNAAPSGQTRRSRNTLHNMEIRGHLT